MATRRSRWAASVLLALGLPVLAAAEEVVWKPVARTSSSPAVVASANAPSPSHAPAASIGRPMPIATANRSSVAQSPSVVTPSLAPVVRGRPGSVARAQSPDPDPPAPWPPPPPPASVVDDLRPVSARSAVGTPELPERGGGLSKHDVWQPPDSVPAPDMQQGLETGQPIGPSWGEKFMGWFEWGDNGSITGRSGLQSDHCFDGLISPITAPFFFEDPRALTEVRPIFIYQSIPGGNAWNGGNLFFFGTQARLALSERFSIVLHELGFYSLNPENKTPQMQDSTGFAEIKIGAKYTFLRNPERGSAAAVGVLFEIPTGSDKVFQNVGDLSITPYLSYAQSVWRTSYGTLNVMGNMGYSFSIDNVRSEFFYSNFHLDYNVANRNKIFPLIEVNWIYYTTSGNNVALGTEGADLINFGSSTREGKNYVSLAFGARYKFCENVIAGAAIQFPVSNEKGLQDYRLTFDLIFRY